MSKPTVSVLYAPGTNSHQETMHAFERAGAEPRLAYVSDLLRGNDRLDASDALCIAGGFAHGDHMGAGNLAGQILKKRLGEQLDAACRKPVIAICNGFQIAVRAGVFGDGVSLTINESGTFRNIIRQPHVVDTDAKNVWLEGMEGRTLHFPCAHGEGRFTSTEPGEWRTALRYPHNDNPDGSQENIAGISSPNGLVLGLMDHPERLPDEPGTLDIFVNGVRAAST